VSIAAKIQCFRTLAGVLEKDLGGYLFRKIANLRWAIINDENKIRRSTLPEQGGMVTAEAMIR